MFGGEIMIIDRFEDEFAGAELPDGKKLLC